MMAGNRGAVDYGAMAARFALVWLLPLSVAVSVGHRLGNRELPLLPGQGSAFYGYADGQAGGRSVTTLRKRDGSLLAVMDLLPGHPTPYAGFGLALTDSTLPKGMDLTPYQAIEVEMRSPNMRNIGFQLITWVDGFPRSAGDLPGKYLDAAVPISPTYRKVRVPFDEFHLSSWWPQAAGVEADAVPTRWDLVKHLEVRLPIGEQPVRHDTIEIRSMRLVGTDRRPLLALVLLPLLGSTLWMLRLRRAPRERARPVDPSFQVEVPSGPEATASEQPEPGVVPQVEVTRVDLPNRSDLELQALLQWIGLNYHRDSILVEEAARGSGVSVRRIPQLLREHCGKSFPAYVASLRIAQACRLLRETDRQVSEIALAVGFTNPGHFHRVFKAETGDSPSAWRERPGSSLPEPASD